MDSAPKGMIVSIFFIKDLQVILAKHILIQFYKVPHSIIPLRRRLYFVLTDVSLKNS